MMKMIETYVEKAASLYFWRTLLYGYVSLLINSPLFLNSLMNRDLLVNTFVRGCGTNSSLKGNVWNDVTFWQSLLIMNISMNLKYYLWLYYGIVNTVFKLYGFHPLIGIGVSLILYGILFPLHSVMPYIFHALFIQYSLYSMITVLTLCFIALCPSSFFEMDLSGSKSLSQAGKWTAYKALALKQKILRRTKDSRTIADCFAANMERFSVICILSICSIRSNILVYSFLRIRNWGKVLMPLVRNYVIAWFCKSTNIVPQSVSHNVKHMISSGWVLIDPKDQPYMGTRTGAKLPCPGMDKIPCLSLILEELKWWMIEYLLRL